MRICPKLYCSRGVGFSEDFEQFSQEIRLASSGEDTVGYILGAYYQTNNLSYHEPILFPASDLDSQREFASESDSWAIFGQATWNMTDILRLVGGLRYTEESKEAQRHFHNFLISVPGFEIPNAMLAPLGIENHDLSGKRDEESLTPVLTVQYDIGDSMVYATATTGFKAGGFDARSALAANWEFEDENVLSAEVGAKFRVLDGTAELNVAAFWMKFDDMQTSVFDGSSSFFVQNAGKAESLGIEMDGRWRVTESLTLTASLGYLDFQWKDFGEAKCFTSGLITPANLNPDGQSCDLAGKENAYTPEWTATLGANHVYRLSDNIELKSAIDILFMDNHYVINDLNPNLEQSGYTKVNARIAIAKTDNKWEVALVGKNLSDKLTYNYGSDITFFSSMIDPGFGGYAVMTEPPRSITMQGTYRF